jgi:hypothetical protein
MQSSTASSDGRIDDELRAFLGFAYNLKAIADYETGPNSEIPPERAVEAVTMARQFVSKMIELIEADSQGERSSS